MLANIMRRTKYTPRLEILYKRKKTGGHLHALIPNINIHDLVDFVMLYKLYSGGESYEMKTVEIIHHLSGLN